VELLALGVRVHELNDKLTLLVLKAASCKDDHMASTEQNWLVVTERLKVVRGVDGGPGIGEHGTMIHLLYHLDLITDL